MNTDLQVRALIEPDLDVIRPDTMVTADKKVVMYIENQDGLEKIIHGFNLIVYLNDRELDKCTSCKNGKTGWAEFIDDDLNIQKIQGDVKVYLCVPFKQGDKPPRIDIKVSDMEIDNRDMREKSDA